MGCRKATHRSSLYALLTFASAALVSTASPLAAQPVVPSGFAATLVAGSPGGSSTGLLNPTAMAFAPDGRLFVCQQGGRLRVVKNGTLLTTPFVTLSVHTSGERGLLGVAFDPNFGSNQYVYVYYTTSTSPRHNRISRFTANGDVAVPGSEFVLMDLNNLSSATNHNGGAIHFGADGKLYVAVGENATSANAQSMTTRLGKILRLNPNGSIPSDNPFFATASGLNRAIWALGLRNPFTLAVQPGTGRIFINDVGQSTWEEINDGIAGANYGWPGTEGKFDPAAFPTYRNPLLAYSSAGSSAACAITGGAFYDPDTPQFPSEFEGGYFYLDYCAGFIRRYTPGTNTDASFATGLSSPVDLKVGPDGALYTLARGGGTNTGTVYKISYLANQVPVVTSDPLDQAVGVGQSATFSVTAVGAAPLSYQWQRNGADIAGATSSVYTLVNAQLADNGARFRCRATNSYGTDTSAEAILTVTSNTAPTPTITQPASGTLYSAGNTISYAGTATDPEDGTLPASAFTWRVDFHHDTHTHPFVSDTTGARTGSFVIPVAGETSANVWYRIHLTVWDSAGLSTDTYRDILPRTVAVTLATSPAGLALNLDGQPVATPFTFQGVVGVSRTLQAPSPLTMGGTTYEFVSWSDGGARTHSLSTPASNSTYTATYRVSAPAPDFALSLTPTTRTVVAPGTATYTVTISRSNGFTGGVTLSAAGGSFSPNPVTGNTSTLTAPVPAGTPKGTYSFTITGTSGSLTRTTTGQLVIQ